MLKLKVYLYGAVAAIATILGLLFRVQSLKKKATEKRLQAAEKQLELNAQSVDNLKKARKAHQEKVNEIKKSIAAGDDFTL